MKQFTNGSQVNEIALMIRFSISSLFKSENCKEGFLFSSFFSFLTKFLSFFLNILIAYFFGSNHSTDIYFFSVSVVFIISSFLSSLNPAILLPQAMRIRVNTGNDESVNFVNLFFYIFIAISLIFTFLIEIKPVYFFSIFSKFSNSILVENQLILRYSTLLLPLMVINSYLLDVLVSYRLFTSSVISSFLNSAVCLVFTFLFHSKIGVMSLLLGNIAANIFQVVIQYAILIKFFNWHYRFSYSHVNKRLFTNSIIAQSGNFISYLSSYIPLYMLSNYNEGVISSFNYGQKVTDIITSLITVQFASVVGIKLNELFAEKNFGEINRIFRRSAENIVFVLVPVSICISIYSKEIIEILFQHGTFDTKTSGLASSYLMISILILPFIALNTLVSRLFSSAQKINISVFYQIGYGLLMILLMYLGISQFGPLGYPVAYLVSYVGSVLLVYFVIKYAIPDIDYITILKNLGIVISMNFPVAVIIYILHKYTNEKTFFTFAGPVLFLLGILGLNRMINYNKEIEKFFISGVNKIAIWKKLS
jgi:putative peptidoglycan lipid II flippase